MDLLEEAISRIGEIGPRPTGSDKERELAGWLEDKL